jgi:hypothetical protein
MKENKKIVKYNEKLKEGLTMKKSGGTLFTAQHSTAQHSTAQHSAAQRSLNSVLFYIGTNKALSIRNYNKAEKAGSHRSFLPCCVLTCSNNIFDGHRWKENFRMTAEKR